MESPATAEPIIFIIDDEDTYRNSLRWTIQSVKLKAEGFNRADAFFARYQPEQPGCLLLDVRMPGMNGLELFEQRIINKIHLPTIIMTAHPDIPTVVRAMQGGAFAFLDKNCDGNLLLEKIQQAVRHDARQRLRRHKRQAQWAKYETLSQRERELLLLLVEGKSCKEIGRQLNISDKTAEAHRAKIMRKMGAPNIAVLARQAFLCGLLSIDD
jgi:FixJ family two-component response regulator